MNLPAISCTLSQRSRLLLQAGCTISGRTHTVVFEHTPLPVLIRSYHHLTQVCIAHGRFIDISHITLLFIVVAQRVPRNGIVAVSQTKKSADAYDGINYLTGFSIHHQVIDGANLLSLCTQDPSAFEVLSRQELISSRLSGSRRCGTHVKHS